MNRFSSFAMLLSLLVATAQAMAQVQITRTEPVIERREFDPKNPPAEMPKLNPNEAAVTQSYFGAESRIGGRVVDRQRTGDGYRASIKVDTVRMTLRMRVTIWLPLDPLPKIVKHEEGHRELAEYYYRNAEQIAREQAEALIGQTISATADDYESAGNKALQDAAKLLGQRYLSLTDTPSGRAQAHYDRLTVHGTNAVREDVAIQQSIEHAARTAPATTGKGSVTHSH